jgi:general secretion pathway protein E
MSAPDHQVARLLPYSFSRDKGVLAARLNDGAVELWLREGSVAAESVAEAGRILERPLHAVLLAPERFDQSLAQAYAHADGIAEELAVDLGQDVDLKQLAQELPEVTDLLDAENDAPIIRLINALLTQALRRNASDIHIEQYEARSAVRFRIDGALHTVIEPQRELHAAIVSRVKIMASLDIAEKRLPQDGRIALRVAGRPVDVRVSTLPAGHGERVVLRLLDKQAGRLELESLGMSAPTLERLDALIHEPHGIVLVTGPTGSGKTTTLYAALSRLDRSAQNMMTVEDPIEYELDGVSQTQVNAAIDMTFARALRSILRQDPDVLMIGEIRDLETAQIAVQASLTGHLVLATLHTNDAAGAVTRLIDMGIEPFLLASSLLGVMAQRLVRTFCSGCAGVAGCAQCGWTGFRGRTGIYELMVVDAELRRMIHDATGEPQIRDYLVRQGMPGLREDGMRWVTSGATSREEVLRVTR